MTYEYVCQACGHQWEAEQSIKDAPLKKCASCRKNQAKRLVSGGTGFLLKGGGWYADGYGSSSPSGANGSAESAETKSADAKGSDAKGSDAKTSETKSADAGGASKAKSKTKKASENKPPSSESRAKAS